jgi:hypothetical protein
MLLVGLLLLALPGCISYRLDRLAVVDTLPSPPPPDQRPSLTYDIRLRPGSDFQTMAQDSKEMGFVDMSNELAGTLAESGWFASVTPLDEGGEHGDVHIDVQLTVTANDAILVAAGLTLFVIPTWRTVTFDMAAEVQTADGRWRRFGFVDAARDVYWLPILLGMSFAPWGGVYVDIRENLYRNLVAGMHAEGLMAPR